MNKQTEARIILFSVQAAILVAKLEELCGDHPDNVDDDCVVPLREIQALVKEFNEKTDRLRNTAK